MKTKVICGICGCFMKEIEGEKEEEISYDGCEEKQIDYEEKR